ncbi:Microcystin-dependent protein [Chitinophaga jiangningensis]|uniref:Microcystin-dependent protein n=1 Tax=Chitinophaga jiangningensis TaxID=1419482 RepID=A0A1M7J0J8_9BACT|nr:tail fiber protein [Chitinophaga jiangningensis]SHM46422.1 Microcystin-dependent protein [Chitinophaga jiangningensis]
MEPYLASLLLFAGNFAIRGYQFCWGQILSIAQNTALFSLVGTTYGGNGQTTFGLPDLRGRFPMGWGQGPGLPNYSLGQIAGTPTTTLLITNMPAHNHTGTIASASVAQAASAAAATTNTPGSTVVPAQLPTIGGGPSAQPINGYAVPDNTTFLAPTTNVTGTVNVGIAGGSQPFSIMNPYLAMSWLIATEGIFPSRN